VTAAALPLYALPAIGTVWPGQGGTFAGLVRDVDGRTRALIVSDARPDAALPWRKAMEWAAKVRDDGHADFALPTRNEARVLWANAREAFEPEWHWLSEEYDRAYAWYQLFSGGDQYDARKVSTLRCRAVRSFILQSFDPSAAAA
jgi:hypothetical protein